MSVLTIRLDISDEMKRELDARMQDSVYSSIDEYVSALIQSNLSAEDSWEMTPEIAAALAEGEASGYVPYEGMDAILAETRARFRGE